MFDELLVSRQIVLVTGKGGVGKSVIAAALALRARELGLRPLVFECDAPRRPSLLPGGVAAGDEVKEVAPGILGINQNSDDAIRDYAAGALPSRALADLLFENRIAQLFLKAAPSVTEMATVGRIAALTEKHGADGPVIVDMHATGHALSLLRAPAGIMRVLRSGVLFERARAIEGMLADATRTSFITVALPEELPVTELLELRIKLAELKAPLGPVVLNGAFDDPAPTVSAETLLAVSRGSGEFARAAADLTTLRGWSTRCAREEARLKSSLSGAPVVRLPWLFDEGNGAGIVAQLAGLFAPAKRGAA